MSNNKPGTPGVIPSKTLINHWLKSLFPDLPASLKIEDFGDGVIYCRILNHFSNNPPLQRVCFTPKNDYDYVNNLKHVQASLLQQGLVIPFDVNKISKRKFLENWQLINHFYKHFSAEQNAGNEENDPSSAHTHNPQQHNQKIPNPAPHKRPSFNHTFTYSQEADSYKPRTPLGASFQFPQSQIPPITRVPPITHIAQNSMNMTQYLKENMNFFNSSPAKGKWSVGSQMFQSNQSAIIDRVKEILLKGSHDTQKIRQIKMLLGLPTEEEEVVKIEDDEVGQIVYEQKGERVDKSELGMIVEAKSENPVPVKESVSKDLNKASLSKISKKPFKI